MQLSCCMLPEEIQLWGLKLDCKHWTLRSLSFSENAGGHESKPYPLWLQSLTNCIYLSCSYSITQNCNYGTSLCWVMEYFDILDKNVDSRRSWLVYFLHGEQVCNPLESMKVCVESLTLWQIWNDQLFICNCYMIYWPLTGILAAPECTIVVLVLFLLPLSL